MHSSSDIKLANVFFFVTVFSLPAHPFMWYWVGGFVMRAPFVCKCIFGSRFLRANCYEPRAAIWSMGALTPCFASGVNLSIRDRLFWCWWGNKKTNASGQIKMQWLWVLSKCDTFVFTGPWFFMWSCYRALCQSSACTWSAQQVLNLALEMFLCQAFGLQFMFKHMGLMSKVLVHFSTAFWNVRDCPFGTFWVITLVLNWKWTVVRMINPCKNDIFNTFYTV